MPYLIEIGALHEETPRTILYGERLADIEAKLRQRGFQRKHGSERRHRKERRYFEHSALMRWARVKELDRWESLPEL